MDLFDSILGSWFGDGSSLFPGESSNYPRSNLIKIDNENYLIEMAIAGFKEDDINIDLTDNSLVVSAEASKYSEQEDSRQYIHRGIARRAFKKTWILPQYATVKEASIDNGILNINVVVEIPEERKPKSIPIIRKS
jgi:molecular chaperone IbpA